MWVGNGACSGQSVALLRLVLTIRLSVQAPLGKAERNDLKLKKKVRLKHLVVHLTAWALAGCSIASPGIRRRYSEVISFLV